jgi:hypothetical protein
MTKTTFILILLFFAAANPAEAQYTLPQQLPQVYQNYNAFQAQQQYLQEQKKKQQQAAGQPANQQAPPANVETAEPAPLPGPEPVVQSEQSVPPEQQNRATNNQWPWVAGGGALIIAIGLARYFKLGAKA